MSSKTKAQSELELEERRLADDRERKRVDVALEVLRMALGDDSLCDSEDGWREGARRQVSDSLADKAEAVLTEFLS